MASHWSLLTGGIAARRYVTNARRKLRELGVLVPASLRARTALIHVVTTLTVGFSGMVLAGLGGGLSLGFVLSSEGLLPWTPLIAICAFVGSALLLFMLCVRLGYVVLVSVYRRALASVAALERSRAVSASSSVAVPSSRNTRAR